MEDWRAEVDKRYQRKHRDVIDPRDEYEKEVRTVDLEGMMKVLLV